MYHHFTLLDGEMVIDTMPDTHKQERRYLVYDMMVCNQECIVEVIYGKPTYVLHFLIYVFNTILAVGHICIFCFYWPAFNL